MTIPTKAKYHCSSEFRFRFAYPRVDQNMYLQGKWTSFDQELLACAPCGSSFVMHHESDKETRREIANKMRADLRLPDGRKQGFLRASTAYVIEQNVKLTDIAEGRFDFGIWWDIVVASDAESLLTTMANADNPQKALHNGLTLNNLQFLLFRNFYVDEVSVRTSDNTTADRVFELAAQHIIPMAEVDALDFYEGSFDLPENAFRLDQYRR